MRCTGSASRSCAAPSVNEAAQTMNDIVREKAYLNGAKFIDIQAHFADEAGNYAPYGPDITGKQRLLREADGVLFTYCRLPQARAFRRAGDQARPDCRPRTSGPSRWPATRPSRSASTRSKPRTPAARRRQLEGHGHAVKDGKAAQQKSAAAQSGKRRWPILERAEGRQRPHHAEEHRRRRPRGIGDDRHPAPGDPLGRDRADDPQGNRRPALADGRRGRRRGRRRACGAELDHAGRRRARAPADGSRRRA